VKYVDFSKNNDSVTPARPIKVSGKRGKRDREREREKVGERKRMIERERQAQAAE